MHTSKTKIKILSPIKAIRAKCMDCSVYQPKEVKNCSAIDCALYPYRLGKNPNRAGIGNKRINKKGE